MRVLDMANVQLFCLPYSGASARVYLHWRNTLPAWLSVLPVELPGRAGRIGEPPQTDMVALAGQLAGEILPRITGPYALFGHGLGALLAFEMAHALRGADAPAPLALIASGAAAPSRADTLLCEGYRYTLREPLECPIHVLGGASDTVTQAQLIDWQLEGASGFSLDVLPGGHLFIHQHEAKVLRMLRACLERDGRRLSWPALRQASA